MKGKLLLTLLLMVGLALVGWPGEAEAQGPEGQDGPQRLQANAGPGFSYQGYLDEHGIPVNGSCTFAFSLFDRAGGGNQLGLTQEIRGVEVVEGAFAVVLNEGNQFGDDAFNGQARWLEIGIDCGRGTTTLSSRHELLAVPYAHSLRPGATISGNVPVDSGVLNLAGGGHGLRVLDAESNGVQIDAAGGGGVVVNSAQGSGVYIHHAGGDGVAICAAGASGPPLLCAADFGHHGVEVGGAAGDGIHVVNAGRFGGLFGGDENQIGILDISNNSHVWKLTANQTIGGLSIAESVYPPSDTLAEQSRLHIEEGGYVGIGTTDPAYRLSIRNQDHQIAIIDQNDNEKTWTFSTVENIEGFGVDQGVGLYEDGQSNRLFVASGGNVSIGGITNPLSRLSVNGDIRSRSLIDSEPDLILGGSGNSTTEDDGIISSDDGYSSSDIVLRSYDTVRVDLNVDGDAEDVGTFEVRDSNNGLLFNVDDSGQTTVQVLQITGGSDLAEQFDISSGAADLEPIPGMVVSIDAQRPGDLIISEKAYDRTVAGIVSGAGDVNPGMLLSQADTLADGHYPVALTGRVYVWADASEHPIQPGDLLTTADLPGHAMKVTDYERAQGAIIGKAMSALDEGQGLVLVLVSLQ